MANEVDFTKTFSQLNAILNNSDLSDVSAESTSFQELPDGYYLCEVETSELTESKSSHQPMVKFQFKVVEDGVDAVFDDKQNVTLTTLNKTKNRKIFKYYVLKDETSVRRFVADMLKFEGSTEGEPILPKEAFTTAETIVDALDVLKGLRIYLQISTTVNDDDTKSTWQSLISWKRAKALELPV